MIYLNTVFYINVPAETWQHGNNIKWVLTKQKWQEIKRTELLFLCIYVFLFFYYKEKGRYGWDLQDGLLPPGHISPHVIRIRERFSPSLPHLGARVLHTISICVTTSSSVFACKHPHLIIRPHCVAIVLNAPVRHTRI